MKKNDMPVRHKTIKRRRIRTVIDRLILIAGHFTVHARKMKLSLGRSNPWANAFIRIYKALATIKFLEIIFIGLGQLCPDEGKSVENLIPFTHKFLKCGILY